MKAFERYYKIGQNAYQNTAIEFSAGELTPEEIDYLARLGATLFENNPSVRTAEGFLILASAFTSGIGYAGANFRKDGKYE